MIDLKHLRSTLAFLCLLLASVRTDSQVKNGRFWVSCSLDEAALRARNDLMYSERKVLRRNQCPVVASKFLILYITYINCSYGLTESKHQSTQIWISQFFLFQTPWFGLIWYSSSKMGLRYDVHFGEKKHWLLEMWQRLEESLRIAGSWIIVSFESIIIH